MLFADDHQPELSFSRWGPGQTYLYRRTVFVPVVAYVGNVEVRMGLYPHPSGGAQPTLKNKHRGLREYKINTLELLPQTRTSPSSTGTAGTNPREPGESGYRATWTRRKRSPPSRTPEERDRYIEGDTCVACFAKTPELTLRIGNNVGLCVPIQGV
jgi:hypothetical protein